jgi:hypothetical protein
MGIAKKATDLIKENFFSGARKQPDPPVSVGLRIITTESGHILEEVCRVNSTEMINALQIGTIYTEVYGSKYITERVDQIKRISKSKGGQGIRELIDMVEAGGKMPGEFFAPPVNRGWKPLEDSEDAS